MAECLTKKRNYCVNKIYSQPVITTTSGVVCLVFTRDYHFFPNPLEYTDPDGKQTHPGAAALNQYITNVNQNNQLVEDVSSELYDRFSNNNVLGKIVDKIFLGGSYEKKSEQFFVKLIRSFEQTKIDTENYLTQSGFISPDKEGHYSEKDAGIFAEYVNNTMSLNYSDQSDLGPYRVDVPKMSVGDASRYLNQNKDPIPVRIDPLSIEENE